MINNQDKIDNSVPGKVYLCQVSEDISCGACCGLYNVADASREALAEMLAHRTEAFDNVPRNMDAILAFKQGIEEREIQKRPLPKFHHCPYIGLVGRRRSRVGCLLHPLAHGNNGADFRGLSFYGGMACRVYFCPTYRGLPRTFKAILREVSEDWYLYGLIITEAVLLDAFFQEMENRLGRLLKKEDIVGNEKCTGTIREILRLKLDWPFRSQTGPGLCNYFFDDQLYSKPPVNYSHVNLPPSKYDTILRELGSSFDSNDALRGAERRLDQLFEQMAQSV